MRKIIISFLSIAVLLGFGSCSTDDGTNFHFVALQAVEVSFPESFIEGNVYNIEATYIRPDNCTFFEGFEFSQTGLTDRSIVLVGTTLHDQPCQEVAEQLTVSFNFEVLYNSAYHFKFWAGTDDQGNDVYLEYEVPVAPD